MTSEAATADLFETEVVEARLVGAKFRRAIRGANFHVRSMYFGGRAARLVESLVEHLRIANNAGAFESASDEEFGSLLDDMQKLHALLTEGLELARRAGLHQKPIHRGYLTRLQAQMECLGGLIETFHLGLDPKFNALVDEAVGQLKVSR